MILKNTNNDQVVNLPEGRCIAQFVKDKNAPTIVFFAGVHGNERAGVIACKNASSQLAGLIEKMTGNVIFLYGNKKALSKNIRFEEIDLNRIWNTRQIEKIKLNGQLFENEEFEQKELYNSIKEIINFCKGSITFIDFHTTSADTMPFITISDSLNNRRFSLNFSVPVVLGLEEHLSGTLLTFMNDYGYISLGFEAGSHESEESVSNCEAFLWLSLYYAGLLKKEDLQNCDELCRRLKNTYKIPEFYQIDFRYTIASDEKFRMKKGYTNFDKVAKNEHVAHSNGEEVRLNKKGFVFMPLYQTQGEDGFFIISRISWFWLAFSSVLRKLGLYKILTLLPGVSIHPNNPLVLIVVPEISKYYRKEIFHLFGFRQRIREGNNFHYIRRDRKITPFP